MAEYIEKSVALLSIEHEDPTFKYAIERVPAADVVEVKHGEWVETYQPLGFDEVKCAECSSCGEDWIMDDDMCIDDYKAHWKYCPCCGAKMDGKENGNNGN